MKKKIYIIIGIILILCIIVLACFLLNKSNDNHIPIENEFNNTIDYNNVINTPDTTNVSINENTTNSEDNELINNNIETQSTNNTTLNNTYTEQIVEKKENVNTNSNTGTSKKKEPPESVQETTKAELPKQEAKVEIPETPEQETQTDTTGTPEQEIQTDTTGTPEHEIQTEIETPKQEEPTPETPIETEQVQLDFSKYDRYYPALNGGYTCFKKNPEEIAKLKSLIEDAIKEFGYENVIIIEDSSIISERYFTANKTNVQNVVYNSDYFTILYYAETEYGLTKNGNERINQIRSYTKVIGQ